MRLIFTFLTVFGLLIGLACQTTNARLADETSVGADGANRITLGGAKKHFDAGEAVFVDTRAEVSYRQEHVKGSINIPAEAMEARWKEIPSDKRIIAYCS